MESVTEHPGRWATALGGAALLVWGANKLSKERHALGAVLAATGAGFILRSTRSDTRARLGGSRGTSVEQSFAINRPAQELYEFWRNLEQLPRVMPELSSVRMIDHRRSHWVARGPAGLAHGMVRRHHQRHPERADRLAHDRGLESRQRRLDPFRRGAGRPRHHRPGQAAVRPARRKAGRGVRLGVRRLAVAGDSRRPAPVQATDGNRGDSHHRRTTARRTDEGAGLARHQRRPRRARSRSRDPEPARRDHQGHVDRDLRLRPAPARRLHPDDEVGRYSRPRVHGRGDGGREGQSQAQDRRPRGGALHDRLRQLLLLRPRSCGRPATTPIRTRRSWRNSTAMPAPACSATRT